MSVKRNKRRDRSIDHFALILRADTEKIEPAERADGLSDLGDLWHLIDLCGLVYALEFTRSHMVNLARTLLVRFKVPVMACEEATTVTMESEKVSMVAQFGLVP